MVAAPSCSSKLRSRCRKGIDATTPGPSPSVKARAVCTVDPDALARNLAEIRRLVGASVASARSSRRTRTATARCRCRARSSPRASTTSRSPVSTKRSSCAEPGSRRRSSSSAASPRRKRPARSARPDAGRVERGGGSRSRAEHVPPGRRLRRHLEVDTGMHRVGPTSRASRRSPRRSAGGPVRSRGAHVSPRVRRLAGPPERGDPDATLRERAHTARGGCGGRPRIRHLAHSAGS